MKLHLYLDRAHQQKDGRCPVRLSAFTMQDGKPRRVLITTGVSVFPKDWNDAKEQDRRSETNNALLRAYLDAAKDFITQCVKNGTRVELSALRDAITHAHTSAPALIPYIEQQAALKRAASTRQLYLATAQKVRAYATDPDRITFADVTPTWLAGFAQHLSATMRQNALAIHLRNLRAVFNAAIDDGLTEQYPFRRFKIRHEATRKRSLTLAQLRTIIDSPANQWRDMFLLIFYLQGINITDLCNLRASDYADGRIEYRRAKTGHLFSVKVEKEAAEIIERYRGRGTLLLDIMERWQRVDSFKSKMNKRLKELYPDLPPLSTYWARHTYATLLAEIDTPVEVISMALGHSIGSRVTQIYIRQDLRKVDEANRRLFDYIRGNSV